MNKKNNQNIYIENYVEVNKLRFKLLTKILNGEQDFTPINPIEDGHFYHLSTLKKFLDGSLQFDVQPTENELKEVQEIVKAMNINNANFLYLK